MAESVSQFGKPKFTHPTSNKTSLLNAKGLVVQHRAPNANSMDLPLSSLDCEYIDTHCHLEHILQKLKIQYLDASSSSSSSSSSASPSLYSRLASKHFKHGSKSIACISIFADPQSLSPSLSLAPELLSTNPLVYGAFGMHPHHAKYFNESTEQRLREFISSSGDKCVAVGETGMDLFKNVSEEGVQREAFIRHCKLAVELGKPLIVHSRNSDAQVFAVLKEHMPSDWPIHMHCFGSPFSAAQELLANFSRLYIGFTGSICFPSVRRETLECVRNVPLDRLLLETDGPYMCPLNKNDAAHPGHIPLIAAKMAEIRGEDKEVLKRAIRENTRAMYGI